MTRTEASRRPCTFGNAAGIHVFTASVFMSFVTRPLRNITASEPLIKMRPRADRSISPAPPLRTAAYSAGRAALVITNRQRLILCGFAAAQCGEACLTVRSIHGLEASPPFGARRSLAKENQRAWPVRQSLTALGGGKAARTMYARLVESLSPQLHNLSVAPLPCGW